MEKKFFAAANGSGGFVSWFDDIFAPEMLERAFILKGGSGTGKSTFMRRVASEGERLGLDCERFYCSSDPDSLDGIILRSDSCRGIAVIDGTAPHTRDPILPGAVEEIINLGDFWDESQLSRVREEIADIGREKVALFSQAYRHLRVVGEIRKLLRADVALAINKPKLRAAIERLLTKELASARIPKRPCKGSVEVRAIGAISTKGEVHLDSYRSAKHVIYVRELFDSSPILFDAMIDAGIRLGLAMVRAPIALEPELTEALYFPELELSIVISDRDEDYDARYLNMARFIDRGCFAHEDKISRKLLEKCADELKIVALERLARVRELHARLESIYGAAMNFTALNAYTTDLVARIVNFAGTTRK